MASLVLQIPPPNVLRANLSKNTNYSLSARATTSTNDLDPYSTATHSQRHLETLGNSGMERAKLLSPHPRQETRMETRLDTVNSSKYLISATEMEDSPTMPMITVESPKLATHIDLAALDRQASEINSVIDELRLSALKDKTEDFIKFHKAYAELETQTKVLLEMTNAVASGGDTKLLLGKRNELADEFNKINYFYYNKTEDKTVDPDSPTQRKKKADFLMKIRKEQKEIQKHIFEAIVKEQNQKIGNDGEVNTDNLRMLQTKQDEIRQFLKKKLGMDSPTSAHTGETPRNNRNRRMMQQFGDTGVSSFGTQKSIKLPYKIQGEDSDNYSQKSAFFNAKSSPNPYRKARMKLADLELPSIRVSVSRPASPGTVKNTENSDNVSSTSRKSSNNMSKNPLRLSTFA